MGLTSSICIVFLQGQDQAHLPDRTAVKVDRLSISNTLSWPWGKERMNDSVKR